MNALLYLTGRSIVNWLRELKQHPSRLILYLAMAAFLLFYLLLPKEFTEEEQITSIPAETLLSYVRIGFLLLVLFISTLSLQSSLKGAQKIFKLSDVNLLFTSPLSSNRILFFGLLKNLSSALLGSLVLLYQLPNLRLNLGLSLSQSLLLLLGFVLMSFVCQLFGMFLYSFSINHPGSARFISQGIYLWLLVGALILAVPAVRAWMAHEAFEDIVVRSVVFQEWFYFLFPPAGFFSLMVFPSLSPLASLAAAGLLLLLCGLCILYIVRCHADYYEDALQGAEDAYAAAALMKEGRSGAVVTPVHGSSRKLKKTGIHRGEGAAVFFYKQLLERRRQGGGLLGLSGLLMFAVVLVFSLILQSDAEFSTVPSLFPAFCLAHLFLFFSASIGSLSREMQRPYLYLVPCSSFSLIFGCLAADLCRILLQASLAFIPAGLLTGASVLDILLYILAFGSSYLLFLSAMLLSFRAVGTSPILTPLLNLLFIPCLMMPPFLAGLLLGLGLASLTAGLLVYALLGAGLALGMIYLCRDCLSSMEMTV